MSNISALGFYAKHPLIMDALYEMDDYDSFDDSLENAEGLPEQLVALARENAGILRSLLGNIDKELEQFRTVYESLRASVGSGAKIPKVRGGFHWEYSVRAATKDRRMKYSEKIEFGWSWKIQNEKLYLYPWAWISGGRAAEEFLYKTICKMAPRLKTKLQKSLDIEDYKWASGLVLLDRIDISERVSDDFSLDLDKLCDDLWKSFQWINQNRLSELFKCSCSIGR